MAAMDRFVSAHYEEVRRALTLALGDAERAEDVTQEAFVQAWRRWRHVSAMDRPVAWVYVVAINKARRDLRRDTRVVEGPPVIPSPDPAGAVVTSVSLAAALKALPPRQRAVVVLRYLADLSNAQVAEALGCAEGTVKSTLNAALSNLRFELEEQE